ncbi:MAG TPA: hypothetical protein VER03_14975 [Bryobacteraceae bacterium]|nr:hypothetical protein [Bryobacteraceae bacterium]
MIVVVGGSSRKAGKTTTICEIIAATREAQWTAVKVTPHAHEAGEFGDTERYTKAGAVRSLLTQELTGHADQGNTIVESNAVMDALDPDVFVFVDGGGDWKPSAKRHAAKAHYIVRGHATSEVIAHIRQELAREQA